MRNRLAEPEKTSLLPGFYSLEGQPVFSGGQLQVGLRLHPEHPIFAGHFPGNPVTPGVCMLQIIKELTETQLGKSLLLIGASQVKFTALINPFVHPLLHLVLDIREGQEVQVKAQVTFGETLALKLNGRYRVL